MGKGSASRDTVIGVARRILANASNLGQDVYSTLAPSPPTITIGTAGAGPTIASAVRIAPKRLSSTVLDTANDPHFEFPGQIPGRLIVSSGDMCRQDLLTGGAAQAARNNTPVKFVHTGSAFEVYLRGLATTIQYRAFVDGLPITNDLQSLASAASSRYYLKFDWGASATREIRLEVLDPEFGGLAIGPTDTVTRTQSAALLFAGFGDSHTRGANGVNWCDTWVRCAAAALRAEFVNLGIGGSGYLVNVGTSDYRSRLTTDITPLAPDVLVFEGSWNDSGSTSAAVQAEALYCMQILKAALPSTLLVSAGPWVVNHNLNAILDTHDAAVKAAALAAGWHGHVSYRDPLNLKATAANWAATTVYAVGDCAVQNGFAQTCVIAHTSTGSFDQTKWRSTAIVGGTGKVGTTTGLGNSDVIVSNDGIHSSQLGHRVKGRHVKAEVERIARSVAAGILWAG